MSFDRVSLLDFKIILLQACHLVRMSFTQLLLYKQCVECWVRDVDYASILQQVGSEVFHHLVNYICLLVNGGVVKFWSLHSCAHEGYGTFIIHLVLLSEYCSKQIIRGEGV